MLQEFTINYRPSIGSFLDEKEIPWERINDDLIIVYCGDANDLFSIALEYAEWYDNL